MSNFSVYRKSRSLLERAAYYAIQASWADSADFEQAQDDGKAIIAHSVDCRSLVAWADDMHKCGHPLPDAVEAVIEALRNVNA